MKRSPAILIATLGSEPQVVTAALELLRRQGEVIQRVEVVHTVAPLELPLANAVEALREAFCESPGGVLPSDSMSGASPEFELHPIYDEKGQPVTDVDTPASIEAAFRVVYRLVHRAKKAAYRVHLSIAGGRKTMAVFGMLAAQLLFDDDDRLWHLYSGGDFLKSKRLYPQAGDDVHLIPIPVLQWSTVSPILRNFSETEDPFEALEQYRRLHLEEKLTQARAFMLGSLSAAERSVVTLLVKEGLGDKEIAKRLFLSRRTVGAHLCSAFAKAADHWGLESVTRTQLVSLLGFQMWDL